MGVLIEVQLVSITDQMAFILLIIFAPLVGSLSSKCGVVSNQFQDAPYGIVNAARAGMSFWWNWDKTPVSQFPNGTTMPWKVYNAEFIPMMWGPTYLSDDQINNLRSGSYVMGYNEPDLYGPPHCALNGPADYRPATSCGAWDPCFNPSLAASNWKDFIDQLFPDKDFSNGPKILSPAMALDNPSGDASSCLNTEPKTLHLCYGWLKLFKTLTLQMTFTKANKETSNYWDIIDYIQIHAYDYSASSVISKIQDYTNEFQEDIDKGKLIWLTELAGGYLAIEDQMKFLKDVIPELEALPQVMAYSWFSVWSFPSFTIDNKEPATERWVSSLFKISGELNELGELYFNLCTQY